MLRLPEILGETADKWMFQDVSCQIQAKSAQLLAQWCARSCALGYGPRYMRAVAIQVGIKQRLSAQKVAHKGALPLFGEMSAASK
ncbi:hypothetical protein [Pseudomonas koreensis]|uniref:hypothetical protein n=1 Tax=Pseudomonas koreensis TaxID=198620 RepID=UPI003F85E160